MRIGSPCYLDGESQSWAVDGQFERRKPSANAVGVKNSLDVSYCDCSL